MRKWSALALSLSLAGLLSPTAVAWGNKSHRVIAELAERHIAKKNPKTLQEMTRLLGPSVRLSTLSTCADDFRGYMSERNRGAPNPRFPNGCILTRREVEAQFPKTAGWHFVNIPAPSPGESLKRSESVLDAACEQNAPCITTQIDHFTAQLKNKKLSDRERAIALLFLTHLIADIHQPLHAVSRNNDQGGNQVFVKIGRDTLRLHSAWDTVLVETTPTKVLSEQDLVSSLWNSDLNRSVPSRAHNARSWAWESAETACSSAYKQVPEQPSALDNPIPLPEPGYRDQAVVEIRKRMYAASVRLADTIVKTLGKS
jgi:hypothetical protein